MTYLDNIHWDKSLQARMDGGTLTVADHLLLSLANFTAGLLPSMTTYIGAQVQNVHPPAAFVDFYDQHCSAKLKNIIEYEFGAEITYLPSKETKNTDELNHAVFLLLQSLDKLTSDIGTFRCYDKNSDITDGIAHVTSLVSIRVETTSDADPIITTADKELIE